MWATFPLATSLHGVKVESGAADSATDDSCSHTSTVIIIVNTAVYSAR